MNLFSSSLCRIVPYSYHPCYSHLNLFSSIVSFLSERTRAAHRIQARRAIDLYSCVTTFSVLFSVPFLLIPNIWFALLTATKCLADVFMELNYSPKFSLVAGNGQLRATCELRAAFPLVHHFTVQSLRFSSSSQSILIFNTQSSFVSWLNLVTSLFTPFQLMYEFAEQTSHISRGHQCWSTSTTRPDHELPLSVS